MTLPNITKLPREQLYPGFDLLAPAINAPIEAGVRPLCDALNNHPEVHTLWSCEGHPEDGHRPYVTFLAGASFAFKVHQAITDQSLSKLHFSWSIAGTFREGGDLQSTIEPHDYRVSHGSLSRWWSRHRWSKSTMAADLVRLAELVNAIKLGD